MPDLEIRLPEDGQQRLWDEFVDQAPLGTLFHKYAWLRAAEGHSGTTLYPLMIYVKDRLVGIFPVFFQRPGPLLMVFSPPPGCDIPHLGPLFEDASSQSEREQFQADLVATVLRDLKQRLGREPDYFSLKTTKGLQDSRPLSWAGFSVEPLYSYIIDIQGELEDIQKSFNKRIRQYIRKGQREEAFRVERGGKEDLLRVNQFIAERYADQGLSHDVSDAYLLEVYRAFPDNIDILTVYHEEEILTGLILVRYRDTTAHWIGSPVPKAHANAANALLYWGSITLAKEQGLSQCEVIGANLQNICQYKAKYNPRLDLYFSAVRRNSRAAIAEWFFRKVRGR